MTALLEAAAFVQHYYGIYVWVFVTGAAALVTCRCVPALRGRAVGQKALFYPLLAVVCCLLGYGLLRLALPLPGPLAILAKMVLAAALAAAAALALAALCGLAERVCHAAFWRQHAWGCGIFLLLCVRFAAQAEPQLDPAVGVWYATDYSMGMGSRFLVGQLLTPFHDGYVDKALAYNFWAAAMVLLFLCIACLADRMMAVLPPPQKAGAGFLLLCLLACPASPAALWGFEQPGRLEMYTLLLCLAAVMLFRRLRAPLARYGAVAVLGSICNAFYQGYMFLYFPLLLMIMTADLCQAPTPAEGRRRFAWSAAACVPPAVSFLVFQFCSSTVFASGEEMVAAVQARTNIDFYSGSVTREFFTSLGETWNTLNARFLLQEWPREKTVVQFLLLLPLAVVFTALYLKCFALARAAGKSPWRTPYPWFLLVQLCVIPQFLLNIDWGRWFTAMLLVLFFGVFYLAYCGAPEMSAALESLSRRVRARPVLAVLVLLYLASLDAFHGAGFPAEAKSIWQRLRVMFFE